MINILKLHRFEILAIFIIFNIYTINLLNIFELNIDNGISISFHDVFDGPEADFLTALIFSKQFFTYFSIGTALSILLPILNPLKASLLAIILMSGPIGLNYIEPTREALLPLEYSLLTVLMLFIANVLISYFVQVHSKQKIIDFFLTVHTL